MSDEIVNKQCSKCKQIKPLSEYYRDPRIKSGIASICKKCHYRQCRRYLQTDKGREANRKSRIKYKHSLKGQASNIKYRKTKYSQATKKRYAISPKGRKKAKIYAVNNRLRHPLQINARNKVAHYTKMGYISKPSNYKCKCGKQARQYHHYLGYSYEHWLDIIPVCIKCHKLIHKT